MSRYRPSVFSHGERDANEKTITAVLDVYHVQYCLMPPVAGFDILVQTNPMECWEVKNPSQKWKLTEAETAKQRYCRQNGIIYRIIEYQDQAVDALAAKRPAVNVYAERNAE